MLDLNAIVDAFVTEGIEAEEVAKRFKLPLRVAVRFQKIIESAQEIDHEAPMREAAFALLETGATNEQLAAELNISRNAARIHRYNWTKVKIDSDPLLE